MNNLATRTYNIKNPEKWVGKYVRHASNWKDYQWIKDGYFVCEWTGKLFKVEDETGPSSDLHSLRLSKVTNYDECCYYSSEAMIDFEAAAARWIKTNGRKSITENNNGNIWRF